MDPDPSKPKQRFSEKKYVLPFGRYVGSTEVEPPADEVLVGREGQRAYLIDLLISTGRRGAYLVTGHRGAGKTSFVKHCISEYEASVLSRFLRGNVGRGVWDRVLVLLFWMSILLGALLSTELVQFFANPASGGRVDLLQWVILFPIGVTLLYPCVYAKVVLEACIRALAQLKAGKSPADSGQVIEKDKIRWAGLLASSIVLVLVILIWFILPFGKPAPAVSLLIPLVCALYSTVQAISFRRKDKSGVWIYPTLAVVLLLVLVESLWLFYAPSLKNQGTGYIFQGNLALGLIFLGLGSILKSLDQKERLKLANSSDEYDDWHRSTSALKDALKSGALWYCAFGWSVLVVGLASILYTLQGEGWWALVAPAVIPILLLGMYFSIRSRMRKSQKAQAETKGAVDAWFFQPRPMWILTAKSIFSVVVALQLAHPILSFFSSRYLSALFSRCNCLPASICGVLLPFSSEAQEEFWLASLLVLVIIFHFVEYEWILRAFVRSREGQAFGAGGLAPWDEREPETYPEAKRRAHHSLAELTLPWEIYKSWLPVLPVAVNLGFDRLDHRRVIQTMLVGLRERYHRTFLAWNSSFANLGRFLGILILLILTALIGGLFPPPERPCNMSEMRLQLDLFSGDQHCPRQDVSTGTAGKQGTVPPPSPPPAPEEHGKVEKNAQTGTANEKEASKKDIGPTVGQAATTTAGGQGVGNAAGPTLAERLWFTVLKGYVVFSVPATPHENLLLFELLPHWRYNGDTVNGKQTGPTLIYLSVYHVLIFLLLFFFGHMVIHRMPLLPYKQNLRRIDDLLDSLSARTKVTSSLNLWGPARWVYSIFSDERVRETERDPVDPRTVELAFLQILEDVQKGGFRFPGAARHHLTMPAPEITFLFDELDKLGTRIDPMEETRDPGAPKQEIQVIHNERVRSLKLRSLLSDLKNILTSAPARFIFVGGRDLHDEWLADQTSRLPLLTSIFNTEVYLPSLMIDQRDSDKATESHHKAKFLHDRIQEYVSNQYQRALLLYHRSVRKRWLPSFGLPVETLAPERFVLTNAGFSRPETLDAGAGKSVEEDQGFWLPVVLDASTGARVNKDRKLEWEFLLKDFILFLTHRSMGNPKKLRDLLSSFIRPAGREFDTNEIRWAGTPCRHVIRLGDVEVFRIQLLVTIYRHLAHTFEDRMVRRDDKYAISIFFLTDFIFKFHRRAFSWSNLERVDDLAHIHRLPDLRELQEEIVDHFSERFLHPVANGLYSFRFRSDVAREVEYLSRRSPAEMAAFNFTLDESLSLKSEYLAAIEGRERNNPDLVAALGELYEFDQDFERARHQYRVAIELLDKDLALIKGAKKKDASSAVYEILLGKGDEHARIFLPWGVARLRLMLQIGMTFELERDLEQAEAEYRSARTLARALVRSYVDAEGRGDLLDGASLETEATGSTRTLRSRPTHREGRLHSLKHMNVLFQPMFSEAWLAEKFFGSVDTSVTLIERGLWEIRRTLPFVRKPIIPPTTLDWTRSHANFSLTLSQLHNKAGDVYFFKGRQPVDPVAIKDLMTVSDTSQDQPTDGYLLRAHYNYAVSLHDLRRYICYGIMRSREFSMAPEDKRTPTLLAKALPDFLFRAAAGSVNDMAEATLARISLFRLFSFSNKEEESPASQDRLDDCLAWLGTDDLKTHKSTLHNWFGAWMDYPSYDEEVNRLITFKKGADPADERLWMSLDFCRVGAGLFEKGGYPEDAGRELLQVCETVTRYLWWGLAVERLGESSNYEGGPTNTCWQKLKKLITSWKPSEEGEKREPGLPMSGLFTGSEHTRTFWRGLIDLGIKVLEEIDALFRQSRYSGNSGPQGTQGRAAYLVGRIIPAEALTLLCSLGLGAMDVYPEDRQESRLKDLGQRWLGLGGSESVAKGFQAILEESVQRHSYPMINRLNGMKVLIDSLVLRSRADSADAKEEEKQRQRQREKADFEQVLEWTLELLDLDEQFDAPLHFTPSHSGMTCALVWLWGVQRLDVGNWDKLDRIYRAAQRDLANSEEMYTMRRSYYEAISGLYYLYDDFNDRQIHYNHAIQMAGAELNALLKDLVDFADPHWREPVPSTSDQAKAPQASA